MAYCGVEHAPLVFLMTTTLRHGGVLSPLPLFGDEVPVQPEPPEPEQTAEVWEWPLDANTIAPVPRLAVALGPPV